MPDHNQWHRLIRQAIELNAESLFQETNVSFGLWHMVIDIGQKIEEVVQKVPGTASVYSERVAGGRYIVADVEVNSPRPFVQEPFPGVRYTRMEFYNVPYSFIFRKNCPWAHKVMRTLDLV